MLVPDLGKVALQDREKEKPNQAKQKVSRGTAEEGILYFVFIFTLKTFGLHFLWVLCTYEGGRITSRTDSHAGVLTKALLTGLQES